MALDKLPISIKKKKNSLVAHHFLTPERNMRKKREWEEGEGSRSRRKRRRRDRGGWGEAAAGTEEVDRVNHI